MQKNGTSREGVPFFTVELFRQSVDIAVVGFDALRIQFNPQSGTHAVTIVADAAAHATNRPGANDTGCVILHVAGRPQPPPASGCVPFGIGITCPCTVGDCIGSRNTHSCFITAKVSVHLINAEQEYLIHCCMAGFGFVRRIFVLADNLICYHRPLCRAERRMQERVVQPFTNCTVCPCDLTP